MVSHNGASVISRRTEGRACLYHRPLDRTVLARIIDYVIVENRYGTVLQFFYFHRLSLIFISLVSFFCSAMNLYIGDCLYAVQGDRTHMALYAEYQRLTKCSYEYLDSYAALSQDPASRAVILVWRENKEQQKKMFYAVSWLCQF